MLDRLAKLDLKTKLSGSGEKGVPRLDLKKEDLMKLADLGQGNGGSVEKVEHRPTGIIMAKKVHLHSKCLVIITTVLLPRPASSSHGASFPRAHSDSETLSK